MTGRGSHTRQTTMDLFASLKQLKKITPDPAFTATSKRALLALEPAAPAARGILRVRATILKIVETGVAVALTGFFVLLLTGAFSGTGLAPQYAAVNPDALRAEARAIDIQIQLANLNYAATSPQSTLPALQLATTTKGGTTTISITVTPAGPATSTATTTVTIDQALQGLAQ